MFNGFNELIIGFLMYLALSGLSFLFYLFHRALPNAIDFAALRLVNYMSIY